VKDKKIAANSRLPFYGTRCEQKRHRPERVGHPSCKGLGDSGSNARMKRLNPYWAQEQTFYQAWGKTPKNSFMNFKPFKREK